ncbi:MAG: hypothetical protein ACO29U_05210 [Crocinitomicaceae bacterium]|jgi:hypothetical protein
MKFVLIVLTSLALFACGSASVKGKWNQADREEALRDVKEYDSAIETVGTAKKLCFDCYVDSLEKNYENYEAAKRLNEGDRLGILMDCAIKNFRFD